MNYFTFDGERSDRYGVGISGSGTFNAPQKDVEMVSVPGRNGDLTISNNRFENIKITYPAYIASKMPDKIGGFFAMLLSGRGYKRLEDTYHPEEYRMAVFSGNVKVDPVALNVAAEFKLEFDCKPQRFLKIGELSTTLTVTGKIYNPTLFEAKPLLRLYGTGYVKVNSQQITVNSASGYTDIDCELMEAYKGSTNCNANVVLPDSVVLIPGDNVITISGITQIDITPRWWTV